MENSTQNMGTVNDWSATELTLKSLVIKLHRRILYLQERLNCITNENGILLESHSKAILDIMLLNEKLCELQTMWLS